MIGLHIRDCFLLDIAKNRLLCICHRHSADTRLDPDLRNYTPLSVEYTCIIGLFPVVLGVLFEGKSRATSRRRSKFGWYHFSVRKFAHIILPSYLTHHREAQPRLDRFAKSHRENPRPASDAPSFAIPDDSAEIAASALPGLHRRARLLWSKQ